MSAVRALLGSLAVLLAACAGITPPPSGPLRNSEDFSLSGRVLVRQADRAEVLRIGWSHVAGADHARLETSLGQTVAEITIDADGAHATLADGRQLSDTDDQVLAEQLIGVPVPLRRFADWARARPAGNARIEHDKDGSRILRAEESGWSLVYSAYGEAPGNAEMPASIEARRADITVRLRIEKWTQGIEQ